MVSYLFPKMKKADALELKKRLTPLALAINPHWTEKILRDGNSDHNHNDLPYIELWSPNNVAIRKMTYLSHEAQSAMWILAQEVYAQFRLERPHLPEAEGHPS